MVIDIINVIIITGLGHRDTKRGDQVKLLKHGTLYVRESGIRRNKSYQYLYLNF
jgi:hypothetical protein